MVSVTHFAIYDLQIINVSICKIHHSQIGVTMPYRESTEVGDSIEKPFSIDGDTWMTDAIL